MTIVQFAAFFVILLQWVYYFLYNSSITTSGALLIFQTGPAETLEYFHSLGLFKVAAIVIVLALILSGLFLLNYRQRVLPKTHVYRKVLPIVSLLLIIAPSVGALSEEIFPEAFPIRTFIDTHDYMKRSAMYAENHDDKYAALYERLFDIGDGAGDETLLPVDVGVDLDIGRQLGLDVGERGVEPSGEVERAGVGLLGDGEHDRRSAVLRREAHSRLLGADGDVGHVLKHQGASVGRHDGGL